MRNILITGAASGLGRAFLEHYSPDEQDRIWAIDVAWPAAAATKHTSYHAVDVTSEADVDALARTMRDDMVGRLDLVVHAAGVRGLVGGRPVTQASDVAPAEALDVMTAATLMRTFEVNAVGTFELVRRLLPLLRRRGQAGQGPTPPKVLIMGSRMGSIAANGAGGGYAYRASKAALNAIVRSLALDVADVCFVVAHPGRVATALCGGVREPGAVDAAAVVPALAALLDGLTLADSGRFVDRFGHDIAW